MKSVLFAELAELVHFKSVRVVLLVLFCVVISLFALCARQSNLYSHFRHLLTKFGFHKNKWNTLSLVLVLRLRPLICLPHRTSEEIQRFSFWAKQCFPLKNSRKIKKLRKKIDLLKRYNYHTTPKTPLSRAFGGYLLTFCKLYRIIPFAVRLIVQ